MNDASQSLEVLIRFSQHPCDTLTKRPFAVDVTYSNNGKEISLSQLPLDVMGPCLFLGCFRTPQYPGVDIAGTSTIMYMAFPLQNLQYIICFCFFDLARHPHGCRGPKTPMVCKKRIGN